jgi:hypothetical protein
MTTTAGSLSLLPQVRRDQADDGAERDDGDDAVEGGEQRRHLVADLAGVAVRGAGAAAARPRREFLRGEQRAPGKAATTLAGQRDAVAGDGDDGDAFIGPQGRLAAIVAGSAAAASRAGVCGSRGAVRRARASGSAPAAATGN